MNGSSLMMVSQSRRRSFARPQQQATPERRERDLQAVAAFCKLRERRLGLVGEGKVSNRVAAERQHAEGEALPVAFDDPAFDPSLSYRVPADLLAVQLLDRALAVSRRSSAGT